ncbi:MAG: hypothetical protein ACJ786_36080 [Catenulispora sp.]
MARRELHLGAGLVLLAAGVWYLWAHEAKTHNISLPEATTSATGYYPYIWWAGHSRGNAYVHHYPDTVGPNVLPLVLQTEDGTLSAADSEVGRG